MKEGEGIRFTVPLKSMLRCSSACVNFMSYAGKPHCNFPSADTSLVLTRDEHKQVVPHKMCLDEFSAKRDLTLTEIED